MTAAPTREQLGDLMRTAGRTPSAHDSRSWPLLVRGIEADLLERRDGHPRRDRVPTIARRAPVAAGKTVGVHLVVPGRLDKLAELLGLATRASSGTTAATSANSRCGRPAPSGALPGLSPATPSSRLPLGELFRHPGGTR